MWTEDKRAAHQFAQALRDDDRGRPRSKQTHIGPSEYGGCGRRIYHKLRGDEPCNPDYGLKNLGAILGTAFDEVAKRAFQRAFPFGHADMFVSDPVRGTLDLYDEFEKIVWDVKLVKNSKMSRVRQEGPGRSYEWQIELYGEGLVRQGYEVDEVGFLFVPKEQDETKILAIRRPRNPEIVAEALARMAAISVLVVEEDPPEPEEHARFCRYWCPYAGELCPTKSPAGPTWIEGFG